MGYVRVYQGEVNYIFLLEVHRTRDETVQAKTHTQRHMNNAWSEMVILTPCLVLYCLEEDGLILFLLCILLFFFFSLDHTNNMG